MTSTIGDRVRGLARRLRPGGPGGSSGLFGLVVGLLVGVMVSALVFPKDVDVVVRGDGGTALAGDVDIELTEDGVLDLGDGASGRDATSGSNGRSSRSGEGVSSGTVSPTGSGSAPSASGAGSVTTIRVGIGVLDLGAISNLGPAFDNGDGEAHMRAWLEGVRSEGLLPANGYDLEFFYRRYDVIQAESQQAACRGFVEDDQVQIVLAGSNFQLGAECVAREFRTPLLTSDALAEAVYERAPFLFTFQMSIDRLLRNWVHWAHRNGSLEGKRLGLFYAGNAENEDFADRVVKPELAELGYELTAEAAGNPSAFGGPEDGVAAQRFQAQGVDLVLMMAAPTAFTRAAEEQRYRPDYITMDHFSNTTNTATSNVPPEQYDGALGMTGLRYGEWRAGLPSSLPAQKCVAYYEAASGRRVDGNEREAEWIGMNKLCDGGWALLDALSVLPGGAIDKPTLAGALQALTGVTLGIHDDVTFEPGRHHGTVRQRTVVWHADCRCWKATGRFAPLLVR